MDSRSADPGPERGTSAVTSWARPRQGKDHAAEPGLGERSLPAAAGTGLVVFRPEQVCKCWRASGGFAPCGKVEKLSNAVGQRLSPCSTSSPASHQ